MPKLPPLSVKVTELPTQPAKALLLIVVAATLAVCVVVTVAAAVAVQPLASVTVNVYDPAVRPVCDPVPV